MNNMMIDLETLATSANAAVVSVGAAVFNREKVLRSSYWVLDLDEQYKAGRVFNPDTISWWMGQSEEARSVFKSTIYLSLNEFAKDFESFFDGEKLHLWGNGADFDLAIMVDMWERHSLPKIDGWKYYHHMCYRTFNQLFQCKRLIERKGTHHNALDDAIHQANCVIASGKLTI